MSELSYDGNYHEIRAELQALRKRLEQLEAREAALRGSVHPTSRRRFPRRLVFGSISLAAMLTGSGLLWGNDIKALFIDPAGNVGIGTQNPKYPLQVGDHTVDSDGKISIGKKNASGNRNMVLGYNSDYDFGFFDSGDRMQLGANWDAPEHSLYINEYGNVGVGTANPKYPLQVGDNTVNSDGRISIGKKDSSGAARNMVLGYNSAYDFGFLDSGSTMQLGVSRNAPANSFYVDSSGNIGMGIAAPNAKLDVRGDIRFASDGAMSATGSLNENLRIVRGTVGSSCKSQVGEGFTPTRNNTGECLITFSKPFSGVPSASVTQIWENNGWGGDTRDNAVIARLEAGFMRVIVGDSGGNKKDDRGFTFVVVGPR